MDTFEKMLVGFVVALLLSITIGVRGCQNEENRFKTKQLELCASDPRCVLTVVCDGNVACIVAVGTME